MIGGLASVLEFDAPWLYPVSTWISWLAPLMVLEAVHFFKERGGQTFQRPLKLVSPPARQSRCLSLQS